VRLSWPLDTGPDPTTGQQCLRARQGANELQTPGTGWALYGFRLAAAGPCKTWFRVRWATVAPGNVMCNNSWFAEFDDRPPDVIGNETGEPDWFWQAGPALDLAAGLHWLRIELREDGPLLERIAIVPAAAGITPAELDRLPPTTFYGLAGQRPPHHPEYPIQPAEFCALPTDSLVIAAGNPNEITVYASYQGTSEPGFRGVIDLGCPTLPGLVVEGDRDLACTAAAPFVRRVLALRWPADAARRVHRVTVTVRDADGAACFRGDVSFLKGNAWAFLGPFQDTSAGSAEIYRTTGAIRRLLQPCDAAPAKLAALSDPATLGLAALPLASSASPLAWRLIDDGSCYDWTGAIDLLRVYGPTPPAFAYAVTWIQAETALNHRSFTFQADDSGWLWVNGHVAVELPVDLPREANRLWTSVPLQMGPNPVVVKLTQNQMYWGFRFDVIDWHWQGRRGDVVTGLEPAAWPK
jgi:hypothetical protein